MKQEPSTVSKATVEKQQKAVTRAISDFKSLRAKIGAKTLTDARKLHEKTAQSGLKALEDLEQELLAALHASAPENLSDLSDKAKTSLGAAKKASANAKAWLAATEKVASS